MTPRDLDHFQNWLVDCGAEVLATTSPWEILRVRTNQGFFVVHSDKRGRQTWPQGLLSIVRAYNENRPLGLAATRRKRKSSKLRQEYGALVKRDGNGCFYCGIAVAPPGEPVPSGYEATTEHLVCVAHGGPDHLSNKFLAHRACNERAGNLSAPEKILMRERMRGGD
ncbi:HNH endonuclease [Brucella tritici]|uniref:HNH endonuclease n=1 Tax=Brucella tritici TaxID=94626 RepID=A0A833CPS3_9HYPH|nr:HNH endonuclease [Brucella tritici]KAB2666572.1 HNH endonuclease [Brucella tritici]